VRDAGNRGALLDALFVDVEFFPGVLLLGARGPVAFALGSATLFHAGDFRQRADWEKLGSTLADDNELGRQLQPVGVSRWVVETLPLKRNLADALAHYLRWHKTVRWCEPLGYAGQAFVLPLMGWLAAAVVFGAAAAPGTAVTILLESTMALALCRRAGCRIPAAWLLLFTLWPAVRMATWFLSWLPTPVVWSGCKNRWWGLRRLELFGRIKST
jgi:ceramide glucosyltransferase